MVAVFYLGGTVGSAKPNPDFVPNATPGLSPTYGIEHFTVLWLISKYGGKDKEFLFNELFWEKNRLHDRDWQLKTAEAADNLAALMAGVFEIHPKHMEPQNILYTYDRPLEQRELLQNFTHHFNAIQKKNWTIGQYIYSLPFNPFEDSHSPFQIDSINFQVEKHYEIFLKGIMNALDNGQNPLIIWGTDTEEFYATLLARDLEQRGYLKPASGQKIVFLTSIYPPEENPEHIANLFDASAAILNNKTLSGTFALCAEDEMATHVTVHDVCNNFTKIYSGAENEPKTGGFISAAAFGHVAKGSLHINSRYVQHSPLQQTQRTNWSLGKVMPPLLMGNSAKAVCHYLQSTLNFGPENINAVIIEGMPRVPMRKGSDLYAITNLIKQLTNIGINVIFNNPVMYDRETRTMKPAIARWHESSVLQHFKSSGAMLWKETPSQAFVKATLMGTPQNIRRSATVTIGSNGDKKEKVEKMGIRYIPSKTFSRGLAACMAVLSAFGIPRHQELVIATLSGNAIPSDYEGVLQMAENNDVAVSSAFDYNLGRRRPVENPYTAAAKTNNRNAENATPSMLMQSGLSL